MDLPAQLIALARQAYETPPRAYHAWSHVEEVARRYDEVAAGPGWQEPREVLIAVVFHDAVYVAGRKDNEDKSAELAAEQIARHLDERTVDVARVTELIRLTARHGSLTPADVDHEAALFLDCDMAILGSAPESFGAYDAAIREEYAAVPQELYDAGRRHFLQRLHGVPRIFLSDYFHARLDAQARENLLRALGE